MQAQSMATNQINSHVDCWLRVYIRTLGDDDISLTMNQLDLHNASFTIQDFEDGLNRLCEGPEPVLRRKALVVIEEVREVALRGAELLAYLAGEWIIEREEGTRFHINSTAHDLVYEVLPDRQYFGGTSTISL